MSGETSGANSDLKELVFREYIDATDREQVILFSDVEDRLPRISRAIPALLENQSHRQYIVSYNNEVVAFGNAEYVNRHEEECTPIICIGYVRVNVKIENRGVGTALIKSIMQRVHETLNVDDGTIHFVSITAVSNAKMRRIFAKTGWKQTHLHRLLFDSWVRPPDESKNSVTPAQGELGNFVLFKNEGGQPEATWTRCRSMESMLALKEVCRKKNIPFIVWEATVETIGGFMQKVLQCHLSQKDHDEQSIWELSTDKGTHAYLFLSQSPKYERTRGFAVTSTKEGVELCIQFLRHLKKFPFSLLNLLPGKDDYQIDEVDSGNLTPIPIISAHVFEAFYSNASKLGP